jgi:hypothetical protein
MWVEIAWQDVPSREEQLRAILAAEITDHYRLRMAWIMEQALPLRTAGKLAEWQQALARYPDELQRKLIAKSTFDWADPHTVNGPSHWGIREEYTVSCLRTDWCLMYTSYFDFFSLSTAGGKRVGSGSGMTRGIWRYSQIGSSNASRMYSQRLSHWKDAWNATH